MYAFTRVSPVTVETSVMRRAHLLTALLLFALASLSIHAQGTISGVVNTYTQVTAFDSCASSVTVTSASGFARGDRVVMMQMKGATVDTSNTAAFGSVTNYNSAGFYELLTIDSVSGSEIYFTTKTLRRYTMAGLVQLVRVAVYTNVTVSGPLTAAPWNGTTGGVLALEVSGTLTLNANIDVSGLGFRGGDSSMQDGSAGCTSYKYPRAVGNGGVKGESIALPGNNWEAGRGALASGGGGGNCHNSGGGGGSNGGVGGIGGREWSSSFNVGGVGGYALNNSGATRAFLGGGGGGGHQNNHVGSNGAIGGGIAIISANRIVGNGNTIRANGASNTVTTGQDGAGGGGGGGTLLIQSPTLNGPLAFEARGGNGGDIQPNPCHGPGGGGGGGVIYHSVGALPPTVTARVDSGIAGMVLGGGPCGNYGASPGAGGRVSGGLTLPQSNVPLSNYGVSNDTVVCRGSGVQLTAFGGISYRWSPATGLSNPNVANPVASPLSTTTYTVTITDAQSCVYARQVRVQVLSAPMPLVSPSGVVRLCPGDSTVLAVAPGYVSYLWSTGATTPSITVSSPGSYTVTVTDINGCAGTSVPVFVVNYTLPRVFIASGGPTTICNGDSVRLSTPLGYSAYLWSTGETTRSIYADTTAPYWAILVDTNGCTTYSDTVQVIERARPNITLSIPAPPVICIGDSLAVNAPAGYASYLWSTGATSTQIQATKGGDYWVDVTDAFGCITRSDTITVATLQPPIVTAIANGPTSFCQGDSVELFATPGMVSYVWSNGATSSSIWVKVTGLYSVQGIDINGCAGTSNIVPVNVTPAPIVRVTPVGPSVACFGDSVTLQAPSGFISYLWTTGDTAQTIRVGITGDYAVSVTDSTGCSGTSPTARATIRPQVAKPAITVNGATTICEGSSVMLTAPTGYASYRWSTGATTQTIRATANGNYAVVGYDAFGCGAASDSVMITVNPAPPRPGLTAVGPTTICGGDSVLLSVVGSYSSYLWSTGDTTPSIYASMSGDYRVTGYDAIGCGSASAPLRVTVLPNPKLEARPMGDTIFCEGDTLRIVAPTGYASYLWSTGDTTRAINVVQSGSYSCLAVTQTGCPAISDTINVTVHPAVPKPTVVANGAAIFCQGDSVLLTAPSGYTSYYWSNGSTEDTIMVRTSGDYTVTVTDSNGCRAMSDPMTITVHASPRPVVSTSGSTTICEGDTLGLSVPAGYLSYRWSNGDTTRLARVWQAGSFFVTVLDSNGCAGNSNPVEVFVNPRPAKPSIAAAGPTSFCEGDSLLLEAPLGYAGYLWSNGEQTPSILVTDSGAYSVTVYDSKGCPAHSDTIAVTVWNSPVVPTIAASGPTTFCEGDSVQLDAPAGFARYEWSNGDTLGSIVARSSGDYAVRVYDSNGCSSVSKPTTVTAHPTPMPKIAASGPTTLCKGDSVVLSAPIGHSSYLWSTGARTRSITVVDSGFYSVAVVDMNSCPGNSDTVQVVVNPRPAKPLLSTYGPTTFCDGDSLTLGVNGGYNGYLWSTGETTQTIVVRSSGRYAVMGLDTNNCGTWSDTIDVLVNTLPTPRIAALGGTEFCDGDSVTLQAPAGFVGYLWSTGDTTESIVARVSGDYTVSVTDTNGCIGISDPETVTVHALPAPIMSVAGPTTFCDGDSVMLGVQEGFSSYVWSNGDTTPVIAARVSGEYFVAVSDSNGCVTISDTIPVTVHPNPALPVIAASGPTTFCDGDSLILDAPSGHAGYLWTTGDTTRSILVWNSGIYAVTVRDTNGCETISAPTEVVVYPLPLAAFTGPDRTCRTDAGFYELPVEPNVVYRWSTSGVRSVIISGENRSRMRLRWLDSGTATVSVTAFDTATGCTNVSSMNVTIGEPFVATISGATRLCSGDSIQLDAGAGFYSYRWSTGDTTQTILVREAGDYSVEVENAGGCRSTASAFIDMIYGAPEPVLTVTGSMRRPGDTVTLSVNPQTMVSYAWRRNGVSLPGETSANLVALLDGIYRVDVVDSNGCHGHAEVEITLPLPAITGVSLPAVTGAPGDTVLVPLRLEYMQNLDTTQPRTYVAKIRFNKSLLIPVGTSPRGDIDGEDRVVTVNGYHIGGPSVLTELSMLSMLGNAESADLMIESFQWDDLSIAVERIDGRFNAIDLCREGGTRLFDRNGGLALEQNRPNPASGVTEIIYETRETGRVRLILADMLGRDVATLVDTEIESGRYSVLFDAGVLPSGLYLCRLEVPGGVLSRLVEVRN